MIQIPYEQVKELLHLEELFEPVKKSFIDYSSSGLIGIPVNLLHFPNGADTHIKIAALKDYDYFSIKVVSMFPENIKKSLSPYSGAIFLFDSKTGFPVATINDKGIITDLRTAAAGAVITDFVAPKTAKSVAVIGTGLQAYHQVIALSKLREIDQLIIYGRNNSKSLALKQKLINTNLNVSFVITDKVEEAVKKSEVIITTTSSKTSLIKGEWLKKGQHITAMGADDSFKNEIDCNCFTLADAIFVDSLELNTKYGEYSHALKAYPELIDKTVEFGKAFQNTLHSTNENKVTIAKLVGIGVQDLAASILIMNKLKTVREWNS